MGVEEHREKKKAQEEKEGKGTQKSCNQKQNKKFIKGGKIKLGIQNNKRKKNE